MKNKEKSREIVKIGIQKHLQGISLVEISSIYEKYFHENNLSIREKSFVKNLTMVSIRKRGIIEYIISKYLKRPLPKRKLEIKAILIMGVAQILFTRVKDYAAVNTSVNFFDGKIKKWRSLANAILRKIIREENIDEEKYDLALNVTNWLYDIWKLQYGEEQTNKIISTLSLEPYLELKFKKNVSYWKKEIGGKQVIYNTLRLKNMGEINKIKGYSAGEWWVQNLAAQIPVMLLKDLKNKEVLELCSAPGGKTAQLLNEGAIVTALDISKKKISLLYHNIKRLKLEKNLTLITKDLIKWETHKKFKKIILDVPCSATGTARKNPDVLWNKTKEDIKRLSTLQTQMLEKAITLLSENGILIYSNCSLQYEEGENVIEYVIKRNKVKLLPISPNELHLFPKNIFNKGLIRTLPYMYNKNGGLEGFFVARLKKISHN